MGWEYIYKVCFCWHSIHPTWCACSLRPLDWNTRLGWWTFVQPDYCSAWTAWAQIKLFFIFSNFWKINNPTGIHFWVEPLYSVLIVVHGRLGHFYFFEFLTSFQPCKNSLLGWTFVQHAYCSAWAAWAQIKLFFILSQIINPIGIHFWVEPLYSLITCEAYSQKSKNASKTVETRFEGRNILIVN
jgi:hypothetical protein